MTPYVYDDTNCQLGEGPLWHPERQQFFWFDILRCRLYTREGDQTRHWEFPGIVSAAGWIDRDALMIVSETGFHHFDIDSGKHSVVAPLESRMEGTRSNDGRVDPFGGFWIGTMGKGAEARAGSIWRYYRGEVRRIYPGITIPNAMCFSPDGLYAYFADTLTMIIQRVKLGTHGWPAGEPEIFIDLSDEGLKPDGATVDAAGHIWNAQWGAHRVAEYDQDGQFLRAIQFPPAHTSCPAFGGAELTTLFCTSAMQGIPTEELAKNPAHGRTYACDDVARGLPEYQVIL